jgi:hypothetical protein
MSYAEDLARWRMERKQADIQNRVSQIAEEIARLHGSEIALSRTAIRTRPGFVMMTASNWNRNMFNTAHPVRNITRTKSHTYSAAHLLFSALAPLVSERWISRTNT